MSPSPEIDRRVSLTADDLGLMGKPDLVSCDPGRRRGGHEDSFYSIF